MSKARITKKDEEAAREAIKKQLTPRPAPRLDADTMTSIFRRTWDAIKEDIYSLFVDDAEGNIQKANDKFNKQTPLEVAETCFDYLETHGGCTEEQANHIIHYYRTSPDDFQALTEKIFPEHC